MLKILSLVTFDQSLQSQLKDGHTGPLIVHSMGKLVSHKHTCTFQYPKWKIHFELRIKITVENCENDENHEL